MPRKPKALKTPILAETGASASHQTAKDAKLVAAAVRQRWPIPEAARPELVKRLLSVAAKKDDPNAMRAASVLVAMDAQNQTDDQLREKNVRLDLGKVTERVEHVEQVVVNRPIKPE